MFLQFVAFKFRSSGKVKLIKSCSKCFGIKLNTDQSNQRKYSNRYPRGPRCLVSSGWN